MIRLPLDNARDYLYRARHLQRLLCRPSGIAGVKERRIVARADASNFSYYGKKASSPGTAESPPS
jgi:hypothetical protein